MTSILNRILLACSMAIASAAAYAQSQPPGDDVIGRIPEPGVIGLIGIGAAIAIAVAVKNRRK